MKLYELTQNYMNLQELLENPDIPQQMIEEALNEVGGEIEEKAENIAKLIKSLEADIEGIKREEMRFATRRKVLETRVNNLKYYLQTAMLSVNKNKIKSKLFTINVQPNPASIAIDNIDIIPDEYKEKVEEVKADKKKIKEAIKQGIEVPGARLVETKGLRIR